MPDNLSKKAIADWESRVVIDWLLNSGRFVPDLDELIQQIGDKLVAVGAPVWRLRLSMRTLHPLVTAVTSVWEKDSESVVHVDSPYGLEQRSSHIGSPVAQIAQTEKPFRRKLDRELSDLDHNVLHELKARGATDYFGLPLQFSDRRGAVLVFTTDAESGFSDSDIRQFTEVASILAPIVEVFSLKQLSLTVAEAYLGPRTGQKVLEGKITRGDVGKIKAAILISDIRDWTGLNKRLSAEDTVVLANRYFEIVSDAVEKNGGEILKLLGDGILAVFPVEGGEAHADSVCQYASSAAQQALHNALEVTPPLNIKFGVGLHFGEVLYGNIGSKSRLDFTVLGQAVNIAARIEGLCSKLGRSIIFSHAFADRLTEPTILIAEEQLKGIDTPFKIYSLSSKHPILGPDK